LIILCDNLLKNLIWKVLFRVLMMRAMNSEFSFCDILLKKTRTIDLEFFFSFVMNRIENDKKLFETIEIWVWSSRLSQIQLEIDLIIYWTLWYQENFE
jgi:hypothetical protein